MNTDDLSKRDCRGCGQPVLASEGASVAVVAEFPMGGIWHSACWEAAMPGPRGVTPKEPKR